MASGAVVGAVAAGLYSGINSFLDAAAFATLVFAPAALPLDVGIQHALLGYMLMQFVVTRMSAAKNMITPVSYEVIPFLAKFAAFISKTVAEEGRPSSEALSTVLVGSSLVSVAAAALFACASLLPVQGGVAKMLPPPMQAGLFASIGYGLYELSFETLSLSPPLDMAADGTLFGWDAVQLWGAAHAIGFALWLASRKTSHPALFPAFVVGITVCVHAVCAATSTSLAAARENGWMMAATEGRPFWTLLEARQFSKARFDLICRPEALRELVCAVLFGPVVNTLLNLLLIAPVVGEKEMQIGLELRAHATGSLILGAAGGYSNYVAISNTAIHIKCGGVSRLSCWFAALVSALFLLVHPLFALVGYVPTLVVAATCVYIGVDFLFDNLALPLVSFDLGAAAVSWAVFLLCQQVGVLVGVIISIILGQVYAVLTSGKTKTKEAIKAE